MARTNENAQKSEVKLFILAGPDAPNLDLLLDAPPGLTVVGMGRPDQEYAGERTSAAQKLLYACTQKLDSVTTVKLQIGQTSSGARSRFCSRKAQAGHHPQSRSCR